MFQSTLPTRGSDAAKTWSLCRPHCFNPRSPRGGATGERVDNRADLEVSIHAPHEGERQYCPTNPTDWRCGFNPRSPRGGATCSTHAANPRALCFNPRSPRGGATIKVTAHLLDGRVFQSTLPTRGSDYYLNAIFFF